MTLHNVPGPQGVLPVVLSDKLTICHTACTLHRICHTYYVVMIRNIHAYAYILVVFLLCGHPLHRKCNYGGIRVAGLRLAWLVANANDCKWLWLLDTRIAWLTATWGSCDQDDILARAEFVSDPNQEHHHIIRHLRAEAPRIADTICQSSEKVLRERIACMEDVDATGHV